MKTFVICSYDEYNLLSEFKEEIIGDYELIEPFQYNEKDNLNSNIFNRVITIMDRLKDVSYPLIHEVVQNRWLDEKLKYTKKQIKKADKVVIFTESCQCEPYEIWELREEKHLLRKIKKHIIVQIVHPSDLKKDKVLIKNK